MLILFFGTENYEAKFEKNGLYIISLQTSHPVLLLQPDRTLRADLLHGSAWIHASTGFGGETYAWWVHQYLCEV